VIKRPDLYAVATLLGMAINGVSLLWMGRDGFKLELFIQAYILGRLFSEGSGCLILFYLSKIKPAASP